MQTIDVTDFAIVLQKLGFEHDPIPEEWLLEEPADAECEMWVKETDARKIDVQLWSDGKHRASHMLNGRATTPPTYFDTPWQMVLALSIEASRLDQKPIDFDPNVGVPTAMA